MDYQKINSLTIDRWIIEGWEWGIPITHEQYLDALNGKYDILLTPTKYVPHSWYENIKDKKVLGLASGGGQQMPIFAALGAKCTILDYSKKQLESEKICASRDGYDIEIVEYDMTKPLPFKDEEFDLIFHPVSNCYVEEVEPIFKECYRILKKGGRLLCGLDNGINYIFDENEDKIVNSLPFNPLKNKEQLDLLIKEDCGIQFSHTIEEQIGGQLKAGFTLKDIYEDYNGSGNLHKHNIPTFIATLSIKI